MLCTGENPDLVTTKAKAEYGPFDVTQLFFAGISNCILIDTLCGPIKHSGIVRSQQELAQACKIPHDKFSDKCQQTD